MTLARRMTTALHLEEGIDGEEAVVADIDMAADGKEPARYRKVAIAKRTLDHRFGREERFQLAP